MRINISPSEKVVVWFSCGAASAVALKKALENHPRENVRAVNNPVIEEGDDNIRFMRDVEEWLGIKIERASHPDFPSNSARDVWAAEKYMGGVEGAPCTRILKRFSRQIWESCNPVDWHVFGFTSDEYKRHKRFVLTERSNVWPVLIEWGLTKEDCVNILINNGIQLPEAYRHGFPNANCKGCIKSSSPTYWNLTRSVYPDVFEDRAKQSREIGAKLVVVKGRRIYLDELKETDQGRPLKSMPECGNICEE